jgi:hypothetical protein
MNALALKILRLCALVVQSRLDHTPALLHFSV